MNEDDIDMRGLLGVLRRQFKLIVMTVTIVLAAAFLYVYTKTPLYTASTLIVVEPAGRNILAPEQAVQSSNLNDVRVDGEIVILQSDAVSVRVVQAANLMNDPEFGLSEEVARSDQNPSILLKTVIRNIQRATRITRKGDTYLISASVTSESPLRAAELTNILAESYIANQIATKVDSIEAVAAILRVRLDEARITLEKSDAAFGDFLLDNLGSIEADTGRSDLAALNAAFAAVKAQSAQQALRLRAVEAGLESRDWATIAENLQSEAVAELERQRLEAESLLEAAANGSQSSIDLRQELARIDGALSQEAEVAVTALRSEVSGLRAQVNDTQAQLRQTVLSGDLPPALLTQIYELQQSSSITRAQYDNFLSRLREVELQAELQVADARIVSAALPPLEPSTQSNRIIILLAGVIATGFGVGLAFLNEYFTGGFTNEAQLASALQMPVAARIPAVKPLKPPSQPLAEPSASEVYVAQPMSAYAESIRRLRVALDQALQANSAGGKVFMVSSTVPEEGKSNAALSLGRTYAGSGLKTLLIDCDLRKPRLHRFLGAEPEAGILDYLTGDQETLERMIGQDPASSLSVLLGAGRSKVPTDQLLVSQRFSQLIDDQRKSFDIIILDTPPLLPVVDGLYLAQYADVIALVVKWASTTQKDVRSILPALWDAKNEGTDILPVLSQERSGRLGYAGQYASYYGANNSD